MKTSSTPIIQSNCPKCLKPFVYIGDVPEGGFPKGMAPYCECQNENKSIFGNYGWICPVCGHGLSPYTSTCPCIGFLNLKVTC